jgi:RimJ/RimL family protein N-acetyltransferase
MELPEELDLPAAARIRALREDDWQLDHALSRVADVSRWTYYPADVSEDEARERVQRNLVQRAEGRGGRFVVELGGHAVGTIGLSLRVDGPHLYYALLPAARGRGLATEAVLALSRWALEHGADAVHARTMVGNAASERVLERASFRRGPLEVEPDGVSVTRWSCGRESQPTLK